MTDKRKIKPIEAWVVVDCFGGIRPHTVRARKKSAVELAHGHVDAEVVKVRIVPDEPCVWSPGLYGVWQACDGRELAMRHGSGPWGNQFRFCPYCGRRIEEAV